MNSSKPAEQVKITALIFMDIGFIFFFEKEGHFPSEVAHIIDLWMRIPCAGSRQMMIFGNREGQRTAAERLAPNDLIAKDLAESFLLRHRAGLRPELDAVA
jgi:hypothetical protein